MSQATPFCLDRYLERIRYSGPVAPNDDVLGALQRRQLRSIPFENFDILLDRPISLEPPAICAKLLGRRRGGYCFELNGLLLLALGAAGFDARPLLARVHVRGEPTGRTHELILVTLGSRRWIADAGFGGPSPRAPMPLELDRVDTQDGQAFRMVDAGDLGTMLQSRTDGVWGDLYSFGMGRVWNADVALGHHFTSTHPSSFFTYSRVAAVHTPAGRTALIDSTLRCVESGVESVRTLAEGAEFIDALDRYFGIVLDAPYEALRPLRPAPVADE